MPTRIAIGVASLVVFLLLVILYVQVRSAPAKPSTAALDAARGSGARVAAAAADSAGRANRRARGAEDVEDPWQRPPVVEDIPPPAARDTPDPEPAPELMRPPMPGLAQEAAGDPADLDREMTLSERLAEANRLYDKKEYEEAQKLALDLLREDPENARMLRIVVSTACAMGEEDKAREFHAKLRPRDKMQMATRCEKYSITLPSQ